MTRSPRISIPRLGPWIGAALLRALAALGATSSRWALDAGAPHLVHIKLPKGTHLARIARP